MNIPDFRSCATLPLGSTSAYLVISLSLQVAATFSCHFTSLNLNLKMLILLVTPLGMLVLLINVVFARPTFLGKIVTRDHLRKSYDYVIVGGGLSGLVIANRLSEDPGTNTMPVQSISYLTLAATDCTVLVVEAGKLFALEMSSNSTLADNMQ
jgi:hypothetical protein